MSRNQRKRVYAVDVKSRVKGLTGFEVPDTDADMIQYITNKAEREVLDFCNLDTLPEELQYVVTDMAAGEYLAAKYASGSLNIEGLDFSAGINSLSEGDTSISYNTEESDSARLQKLIDALRKGLESKEVLRYRRLVW
jgi:hypothetical protein